MPLNVRDHRASPAWHRAALAFALVVAAGGGPAAVEPVPDEAESPLLRRLLAPADALAPIPGLSDTPTLSPGGMAPPPEVPHPPVIAPVDGPKTPVEIEGGSPISAVTAVGFAVLAVGAVLTVAVVHTLLPQREPPRPASLLRDLQPPGRRS